jgi:hypothetical protein
MVRTARYKYVAFNGGARPEQLFDLRTDPGRRGQPGGSRFGACCAIGSERQRTTSRYPRDMAGKRTRLPAPRKRNWSAQKARDQKAGPMKDRRTPRGGAKNTFREDIEQSRQ